MIVAGNGIYERCPTCGKLVKVNKFLFGSLHVCAETNAEKQAYLKKWLQENAGRKL